MDRREFLKLISASVPLAATGCALFRIDEMHILVRSDVITSLEQEQEILSRAKLTWSEDGRVRVLYVQGTPYERGYQHGKLLRQEVQDNIGYLYDKARTFLNFDELFAEVYERMRPFMHQEYVDEMQGLAHGARMPLHVIHAVHVLPEIGEWGGKKRIKGIVKQMLDGQLGTSCSNFNALDSTTDDHGFYAVRILDWGMHRVSRLHEFPLILVAKPNEGYAYANIGWVGFLGAISGMNEQGITLGEMGYGDPPNETLHGEPMPFVLRDVLTRSKNLADVRKILKNSIGTNSFAFLMTDGKTKEGELYVKDRERFLVFKKNQKVEDRKTNLPPIKDTIYGGHYGEKMTQTLQELQGKLNPEILMSQVIPHLAMPSNFQNVIYDPAKLQFWVANAKSKSEWAAGQPYTRFDLAEALKYFGEKKKA